jgi:hypothetical protein
MLALIGSAKAAEENSEWLNGKWTRKMVVPGLVEGAVAKESTFLPSNFDFIEELLLEVAEGNVKGTWSWVSAASRSATFSLEGKIKGHKLTLNLSVGTDTIKVLDLTYVDGALVGHERLMIETTKPIEVTYKKAQTAESKCLEEGGGWKQMGLARSFGCERKSTDGGKACTDSSQCQFRCLAVPLFTTTTNPVSGECARTNLPFGCRVFVEAGRIVQGPCVD